MLLQAKDLTMSIGDRTLFQKITFQINKGDNIGLIGKNGSGKSSLLKVLMGQVRLDDGMIDRQVIMHYIPQLKETDVRKSGGEITQQYIQQAFSQQSGLLLADEPTTHLDADHIEWVENSLQNWNGAFIVVSHDRVFLDATCNKIWEISDGKLHFYQGNYSAYKQQKDNIEKQHRENYEKYQSKKKQLERALEIKDHKAARATKKPKQTSRSEAKITGAKPYFAKKQKKLHQTAKALETRLEKLEEVDKPYEHKPLVMELPHASKIVNRTLLRVHNLSGKIGNKTLWKKSSFEVKAGEKVAIVGPNGSGKTTLLRQIVTKQEGVHLSESCKIGYFRQDLSQLDEEASILENVRSNSKYSETFIRTVLARLLFKREDVYKKVAVLSGGERVKVALAKIFVSDVNTLILDEPTNFLDILAVEALERLLQEYEGTILFVSHDRKFVEQVSSRGIEIKDGILIDSARIPKKHTAIEEDLLIIETRISDILSRLSLEPSTELEEEFQYWLKKKKMLKKEKY